MNADLSRSPSFARIHAGEWPALLVSFLYFFFVLSAYYVIRPVREQLAAAVGSTQLPWFFAATFIATLALTPVFAWLVSRWPRRVVVPVVYLFFIACLLAFMPFFASEGLLSPRVLGIVFFVWVSVFNLFVVSVFWSFMTDIWSNEQARRLFPLIALGGTLGAISGPVLTRQLVGVLGVAPLLLVSSLLLGLALGCVLLLGRRAHRFSRASTQEREGRAIGGGMWDGLKQVFADPFVRAMSILMLLGDAIGTLAYVMITDYSHVTFADAVERTRFAANVDLATNLLQIGAQLTLTRWLLVRHGAGPAIAGWALVGVLACLGCMLAADPHAAVFATTQAQAQGWIEALPRIPLLHPLLAGLVELLPNLSWVVLMLVLTRGLMYGMVGPARESLYTRVPRELRYKGKNAVDTAVWRAGDVASASMINGLKALGAGIPVFAALGGLALAASGVIGWRLARRVEAPDAGEAPTAPPAHA
ncbi:NTP/NDP exchange transporter [Luteimonas sp. e5]